MSIASRANVRLILDGFRNGDDDLGGGLTVSAALDLIFPDGLAAIPNAFNRVFQKNNVALPFPAGVTFDLIAETAKPDSTLNLSSLRLFLMEADPANDNSISLDPTGSANGWDSTFSSDVVLGPGEWLIYIGRGGSLVDATHKDLIIVPTATPQAIRTLIVLGATA